MGIVVVCHKVTQCFPEVGQATAEADIANAKELLEWLKGKL